MFEECFCGFSVVTASAKQISLHRFSCRCVAWNQQMCSNVCFRKDHRPLSSTNDVCIKSIKNENRRVGHMDPMKKMTQHEMMTRIIKHGAERSTKLASSSFHGAQKETKANNHLCGRISGRLNTDGDSFRNRFCARLKSFQISSSLSFRFRLSRINFRHEVEIKTQSRWCCQLCMVAMRLQWS